MIDKVRSKEEEPWQNQPLTTERSLARKELKSLIGTTGPRGSSKETGTSDPTACQVVPEGPVTTPAESRCSYRASSRLDRVVPEGQPQRALELRVEVLLARLWEGVEEVPESVVGGWDTAGSGSRTTAETRPAPSGGGRWDTAGSGPRTAGETRPVPSGVSQRR